MEAPTGVNFREGEATTFVDVVAIYASGGGPVFPLSRGPRAAYGTGGMASGNAASRISSNTLSSPAVRFNRSRPQWVQRWINTQRPSPRTVTAIGSIPPVQPAFRSPGTLRSRCRDHRQLGQ